MGAFATIATTWLTQTFQTQQQQWLKEMAKREETYFRFIDLASQVYVDSMSNTFPDPVKITPIYALVGKMRLFAPHAIVAEAEAVMLRIIENYYRPPIDFHRPPEDDGERHDILVDFTKACRAELSL